MTRLRHLFFLIGPYIGLAIYLFTASPSGFRDTDVRLGITLASVYEGLYVILALWCRRIIYFDIGFSGLFLLGLIASYLLPRELLWIYTTYTPANIYCTLTLVAFLPLLLKIPPFTYNFSKRKWPKPIWETKEFKRINLIITVVWGVLFGSSAIIATLFSPNPTYTTVLPLGMQLGVGLPFTKKFPTFYMRWVSSRPKRRKRKVKILGIVGSPHRSVGSTHLVVNYILDKTKSLGASVELVNLCDLKIAYCTGCGMCLIEGACPQQDDAPRLQQKMIDSEGLVIGSPVYVLAVTAQMKTFLDRCVSLAHRPSLHGKYSISVAVSAGLGEERVARYLSDVLQAMGVKSVAEVTGIAIAPGRFPDKERVLSAAGRAAKELIQAIKEKREYPTGGELILKQKFMRDLIFNNPDLFKADYKYWSERGWFNMVEKTEEPRGESCHETEKAPSSSYPRTIREAIEGMPRVFKPEAAGHIKATIQFHITGDKGGNWHLRIEDGRCTCREGTAEKADLIISTPADVWLRIARGELSGQAAYMSGSYKVKGDMNLLFRMQSMF